MLCKYFLKLYTHLFLFFSTLSNGITIRKSAALKVLQTINFILIFLNKKWKIRFVSQSTLWMTIEELKRYSRAVSTTSNCVSMITKNKRKNCFLILFFCSSQLVKKMKLSNVSVTRCLWHQKTFWKS